MKIDFKNVHYQLHHSVKDYAIKKISRLEKYYRRIIKATVAFEEQKGNTANLRLKVRTELDIPGKNIMAEAWAKSANEAIDAVFDKLKDQLLKEKGKRNINPLHHAKRFIKNLLGK